eukprot:358715-Chlamydomonas_euryale.AAC.4
MIPTTVPSHSSHLDERLVQLRALLQVAALCVLQPPQPRRERILLLAHGRLLVALRDQLRLDVAQLRPVKRDRTEERGSRLEPGTRAVTSKPNTSHHTTAHRAAGPHKIPQPAHHSTSPPPRARHAVPPQRAVPARPSLSCRPSPPCPASANPPSQWRPRPRWGLRLPAPRPAARVECCGRPPATAGGAGCSAGALVPCGANERKGVCVWGGALEEGLEGAVVAVVHQRQQAAPDALQEPSCPAVEM